MPSSPSIRSELMLPDPVDGLEREFKFVNRHERYHIKNEDVVFVVGILLSPEQTRS